MASDSTTKSTWQQFYSVICGNLLSLSFGSMNGWASVNFLELQKTDTLLPSGPLSLQQATLMMSIGIASAVIGNLMAPLFISHLGSKRGLVVFAFPQIISWLLIVFAENPYYFYAARILSGFVSSALGLFLTVFIFEVSHDHNRGTLISLYDPSWNTGTVLSLALGKYFDYVDQAKVHMCVTVLFIVLFAWIPQTPQYLALKQREKAAIKAHKFFKGTKLEKLPVAEATDDKENSKVTWSDFTNRRAKNVLFIACISFALNPLQGYSILMAYVTEIFANTNPNMPALNSSIIITCIVIFANLIFMNLVDRARRRTFYICSSFATTIGLAIFAVYLHYLSGDRRFDWVPIVSLSGVLFVSFLGMTPISFIVSMEILPRNIKNYCFAGCVTLTLVIQFVLTEVYPMVKAQIGLIGWITFFAAMSLCNALFGIFYLPETKGKSYDEIMCEMDNL